MRRGNGFAYPPPRSETERGRGTMRSMVEGASGGSAFSDRRSKRYGPRPFHRPSGGPPSPLRGAGWGDPRSLLRYSRVYPRQGEHRCVG